MFKNEYFSNSYKVLISNSLFHFIFIFIEYLLILISQVTLFTLKFNFITNEKLDSKYFYALFIQYINKLPEFSKLLIIIILFIAIILYFLIYNKYHFEHKYIFNKIVINIFEIFIFRALIQIIFHILLSMKVIPLIIMIILSIINISFIIKNFLLNHLYFFSLHIIKYPYDYYSSMNDVFLLLEKILISISLQSSMSSLNKFLYICVLILQFCNLCYSLYIFYYKSYCIMSNIFLDKSRFSFITSSLVINIILNFYGNKNFMDNPFLTLSINIFLIIFILVQIFYDPYIYTYFNTDECKENLYFYFYIIDYIKNDNFIIEEKIEEHMNECQKCNLCKNIKNFLRKKTCYKKIYKMLYKESGILEYTMNELIQTLLINGKESIKNNSFFLINLMYSYYNNINKKNYVLSINLKLLFEIINHENKNILENHLLSSEQILLINEFLDKADNILDKMKIILNESAYKEKTKHYFSLYNILFELKSKKFKNKLYYNKNEGIINFFKYISICSMLYEEIFNTSLSNGGISLKENQIFLDDISNKSNTRLNQLIIQLDLLSFENEIIYIIGDLAKYKGKALCKLFPNIFKTQQLLIMKKK